MKRHLKIWWVQTLKTTQITFAYRFGAALFIIGKLLRFGLFFLFLFVLGMNRKVIAGYSFDQMLLFFLTFNLVDTSAQLILREVYNFRGHIVSGEFDYFLVKPYSPLIRCLFGRSDILDVPLVIILLIALSLIIPHMNNISTESVLLYIGLVCNGFFIALSFHIFVLCLGIITTEVDNAIFLYRDLTQMGRVPVDIYKEPLRGLLTFIIPVGIMMTFPAKALMGLVSLQTIVFSFMISSVLFFISVHCWRWALKQYSSASS